MENKDWSSQADQAPQGSTSTANSQPTRTESTSPGAKAQHPPRVRRRNRVIASCLECRRRKLKCDKSQNGCSNCARFKRDCLYLAPALDTQSQARLQEIKERMGALEKNIEHEVAGGKPHRSGAHVVKSDGPREPTFIDEASDEDEDDPEDEQDLEPTPLAAIDNVYEDDADDELMDLGVQIGKMRISERIGGWIRPKLVEELAGTLDISAQKRIREISTSQARIQASPKSYIGPGPDYIAPASSFFFPGQSSGTSLLNYLPSKHVSDILIKQYFHAVHYIATAVHRPTLEAQYNSIWEQLAANIEPLPTHHAIVFAALFSAAVSFTDKQITQQLNTSKAELVDSLRCGTEMALAKSNFLRTTKTDTMQAFVMYLIPLVRAEVSRAHSALVGTAVRLAECMGLHRDGSFYNMGPVEIHVRRILWHQLCFLDLHTGEATGPRPQIRRDDYDTKLPLNVNESDLTMSQPPTEDKQCWTDSTFFRMRCEVTELRRAIWFDIPLIDRKKKTLSAVLLKTQKVRERMRDKYMTMLEDSNPMHVAARHVFVIGVDGCFVQVLHRYLFSTSQVMPPRLRQILIETSVTLMENAIALETNPDLAPWLWYKGAYNSFHSALLLIAEVHAYPMRKEASRIWACLDYIFETPAHLPPKQKAELVMMDLQDRMVIYHQLRKLKTTRAMEDRIYSMTDFSTLHTRRPSNKQSESVEGCETEKTKTARPLEPMQPMQQVLPANFGTPSIPIDIGGGGNAQPSVPNPVDVPMLALEDFDWAEWDKYFPIETNSGDLNLPDFNFSDFHGDFNAQPISSSTYQGNSAANSGSMPQNMPDINYGAQTFFPAPGDYRQRGPR